MLPIPTRLASHFKVLHTAKKETRTKKKAHDNYQGMYNLAGIYWMETFFNIMYVCICGTENSCPSPKYHSSSMLYLYGVRCCKDMIQPLLTETASRISVKLETYHIFTQWKRLPHCVVLFSHPTGGSLHICNYFREQAFIFLSSGKTLFFHAA